MQTHVLVLGRGSLAVAVQLTLSKDTYPGIYKSLPVDVLVNLEIWGHLISNTPTPPSYSYSGQTFFVATI